MTSWMSGDQPVNFDRVEHISALSMNSVIKEMEYTKKSLTHLCPSNLKKKIKVERPVYKYRKSTKDLRCFPILCLLFSFSLSLSPNFFPSFSLSFFLKDLLLTCCCYWGWLIKFVATASARKSQQDEQEETSASLTFLADVEEINMGDGRGYGTMKPVEVFPLDPVVLYHPQYHRMMLEPASRRSRWLLLTDWSAAAKFRPSKPTAHKKEANLLEDDLVPVQSSNSV